MPFDLLGSLAVEAQEEASGVAKGDALVLPHHASDVVTAAQLIAEAIALDVKQNATDTAQGLGREELHLGIWLVGMHKTSWMHLHPFQVHALRTDRHRHLQAISSAVVAVGGGQVLKVWAVAGEQ